MIQVFGHLLLLYTVAFQVSKLGKERVFPVQLDASSGVISSHERLVGLCSHLRHVLLLLSRQSLGSSRA